MTSPVETYSREGFLRTLGFATVVVAVSGLVAFLSAPEVVTCQRVSGVRVDCSLARALAGRVPMRTAAIHSVSELTIVEYRDRPGIGQPRGARRSGVPVHRLRFVGPVGEVLSVQSSFGELESLRGSVQRMLESQSAPALHAVLRGSPRVHGWSVGFLGFGLALVPLWVLGYFFPALRPNRRRVDASLS